jgi:hypothetical protein
VINVKIVRSDQVQYKKKDMPHCPVCPGWSYGVVCPWTCLMARVTTRLDSARLGSAQCAMYAPRKVVWLMER